MEKVGAPSWNSWEICNWGDPTSTFSFPSSSPTFLYADQAVPFRGGAGGTPVAGGDCRNSHSLTCLRLGKRQYYGEHGVTKRERPSSTGPVPRCQVEGCEKLLGGAKEYHRRHKVCEVHSKSPWVVVLGTEQRFCQQCSRFHALTEFDDAKRSCRRRLAGHNERRRKSSIGTSDMNVSSSLAMGSGFPLSSPDCVLSLLSSTASPWVPASDLSSRSSAALSELIAENRAALLARQLFVDHGAWPGVGTGNVVSFSYMPHEHQVESQAVAQLTNGWRQFNDAETNLTLDLLQIPGSSFDILPGKRKSNEEEMCCTILKSLQGAHMV